MFGVRYWSSSHELPFRLFSPRAAPLKAKM
ncbi:hypothetical protein L195_g064454, partial [Trifolium pratense]